MEIFLRKPAANQPTKQTFLKALYFFQMLEIKLMKYEVTKKLSSLSVKDNQNILTKPEGEATFY